MIKIIISLTVTLLFCFGIANAEGITVSHVDGAWDNDTKVLIGTPITWTIHVQSPPVGITSIYVGFEIYISDQPDGSTILDTGPGFVPITYSTLYPFPTAIYEENPYSVSGSGSDTVGFISFSAWSPYNIDSDAWQITTQVDNNATGFYLCIDSSSFLPDAWWDWDYYPYYGPPAWDGPHCYLIEDCCKNRGDVVGDSGVFIDDLSFLRNYVFLGGPSPDCLKAGDVIVDDIILVNDLVFLVNYIFKGGDAPPPCD